MLVQVRKLKKHMQRNFGDDCLLPFCPTDCVYSRTKWRNEVKKKGVSKGRILFPASFLLLPACGHTCFPTCTVCSTSTLRLCTLARKLPRGNVSPLTQNGGEPSSRDK